MIGLLAHSEKPAAARVAQDMVSELTKHGIPFLAERHTAPLAGLTDGLDIQDLAEQCELLVAMGGDGTILRIVHKLRHTLPPIFGINIGSLGFLTCLGPGEISRAVASIRDRDYILSNRPLLEARLTLSGGTDHVFHGLNDAVISRGERSELVKIRVRLGEIPLTEYNADGLVVSTPTGSTAYSLSAGGPILMPDSGGFVITPICPHVLTNRSVVVSDASQIHVEISERGHRVFVNVDGQETCEMGLGDSLVITKSARYLPLAMLPERSFSEVLRQKLKWSGTNI
ncbi:MAG: NAD(+)/NADH kinase [Chthoniobacterales bacterium]|nr:NAD(+)/NADH kinase [Chthoniobacterales bacterium]